MRSSFFATRGFSRAVRFHSLGRFHRQPLGGLLRPNYRVKIHYFDRSIIRTNWRAINEGPLKKAGLLVRRIARGSIRHVGGPSSKRRARPSRPGTPPRSRKSSRPFKLIYSVPDKFGTSVVVGMMGFGGKDPIPGLHELGGRVRRRVFANTNPFRHGNRINRRQKTKLVTRTVRYPVRAFMRPALQRALPKLPMLWRTSMPSRPVGI